MSRHIAESDWKVMQQLKPMLLDRLCQQILNEIASAGTRPGQNAHRHYLDVFALVERRDKDVARAFDDWRRSTAIERLAAIRSLDLFTEEEFNRFSEETRNTIVFLCGR